MTQISDDDLLEILKKNRTFLVTIAQSMIQNQENTVDPKAIGQLIDEIQDMNRKTDAVITAIGSNEANPQLAASINAFNLYNFANIEEEMNQLVERVNQGYAINLTQQNMQQLVDALNQSFKMPLQDVIQGTLSVALKDALNTMLKQIEQTNETVASVNTQVKKMNQVADQMEQAVSNMRQSQKMSGILIAVLCVLLGLVGQMGFIFKIVAIILGVVVGILTIKKPTPDKQGNIKK